MELDPDPRRLDTFLGWLNLVHKSDFVLQRQKKCNKYHTSSLSTFATGYKMPRGLCLNYWVNFDCTNITFQSNTVHKEILVVLPGKMYGLLTSHAKVKVGGVFHFICVSCFLYPVTNRVAVHSVHHVPLIVCAPPVMAWTAPWRETRSLCKWVTHFPLFRAQNIYFIFCVYSFKYVSPEQRKSQYT